MYYESGKLNLEKNYVDDKQYGKELKYYESGELELEENYVNGY